MAVADRLVIAYNRDQGDFGPARLSGHLGDAKASIASETSRRPNPQTVVGGCSDRV
jgi:hypothetical protein